MIALLDAATHQDREAIDVGVDELLHGEAVGPARIVHGGREAHVGEQPRVAWWSPGQRQDLLVDDPDVGADALGMAEIVNRVGRQIAARENQRAGGAAASIERP